MERDNFYFLVKYKWSVFGFFIMFLFSILIILFGFWPAFAVMLVSILGLLLGYIKDMNIDVAQLLRNLK
ncbi:MAG: DUF2273 domain-containing protein [Solibacillus sp.]